MGGNVQPIEVALTVIALVGVAFSAYNVIDTARDLRDVVQLTDGLKPVAIATARWSLISESIRAVKLILLLTIGIIAMASPPVRRVEPAPKTYVAVEALFILFSLLLTANTIVAFYSRRRIIRALTPADAKQRAALLSPTIGDEKGEGT